MQPLKVLVQLEELALKCPQRFVDTVSPAKPTIHNRYFRLALWNELSIQIEDCFVGHNRGLQTVSKECSRGCKTRQRDNSKELLQHILQEVHVYLGGEPEIEF